MTEQQPTTAEAIAVMGQAFTGLRPTVVRVMTSISAALEPLRSRPLARETDRYGEADQAHR